MKITMTFLILTLLFNATTAYSEQATTVQFCQMLKDSKQVCCGLPVAVGDKIKFINLVEDTYLEARETAHTSWKAVCRDNEVQMTIVKDSETGLRLVRADYTGEPSNESILRKLEGKKD